jgi:prepilin-type N-terminal cleavage/methylation domain-containing protein
VDIQLRSEEDHKNLVEQGFTLVELLIVILVMGILVGLVVFALGNIQNNSTGKACATEADTFETAVAAWKANNQPVPAGSPTGDAVAVTGLWAASTGTLAKAPKYFKAGALVAGTDDYKFTYTAGADTVTKGAKCV